MVKKKEKYVASTIWKNVLRLGVKGIEGKNVASTILKKFENRR